MVWSGPTLPCSKQALSCLAESKQRWEKTSLMLELWSGRTVFRTVRAWLYEHKLRLTTNGIWFCISAFIFIFYFLVFTLLENKCMLTFCLPNRLWQIIVTFSKKYALAHFTKRIMLFEVPYPKLHNAKIMYTYYLCTYEHYVLCYQISSIVRIHPYFCKFFNKYV